MNKEELIEVLRAEQKEIEKIIKISEVGKEDALILYYRGKSAGITMAICMLTSEEYYKNIAKQNHVRMK